ncbi:MAG: sigma-54-dependent Fis family transcriptional regulator [Chryseotalea sp. WA131a]|jgi:DNA-binding NtrC family response regulator|nr:MAG: sigma-54-dependent Fis family transcriptional regulator [Chryseotalea sp. WA131a]
MSQLKIFLVEDDPWYGELLKYHLSLNPDYNVSLFKNGATLLQNLYIKPDVICIDYGLPDIKGDLLLSKIHLVNKSIPVVIISGQEEISVALKLLQNGASEYIIKDENTKHLLWNAILKIKENTHLKAEVEILREQLVQRYSFEKTIIGQSESLKKIFSLLEKAAGNNINVSITGETGTGKEVVAKAIHFNSARKKKPFVTVNMAAIPKELMESELFGHEKGSFTGAQTRRIGKFEEAQGGTIFLDEIAELDFNLQAKLLRVLQEREITRVGGNESVKLDVRIITATHQNLALLVQQKMFREDLYYRLLGLPITLPALRERGTDILILAKHFIQEFSASNRMKVPQLSEDAREKLMRYNFPGNVRELKAIVDLACVMSDGQIIESSDITYPSVGITQELTAVEKTMEEYNWDVIMTFLKKYNNNVMMVAKKLGIGKSTIYNLIKKNELQLQIN